MKVAAQNGNAPGTIDESIKDKIIHIAFTAAGVILLLLKPWPELPLLFSKQCFSVHIYGTSDP